MAEIAENGGIWYDKKDPSSTPSTRVPISQKEYEQITSELEQKQAQLKEVKSQIEELVYKIKMKENIYLGKKILEKGERIVETNMDGVNPFIFTPLYFGIKLLEERV